MTNGGTRKGRIDDNLDYADSSILLTQYSSEASQLIKSFTKYIPFVVMILILIAAMTIFDLAMDLGFKNILSDETIDAMIIAVSILLILFVIFTVRPVLRSQKILDKWSNLFENNAIRTGILLSINNNSKEEILNALSETIEQLDKPLQHYLSKSNNHNEFYDISIDDTTTIFDILIDKSTIKPIDSDSLRSAIQDYGSILVKIVNGIVDKDITQSFIDSLQKYKKRGNKIGLAMIIGESITQESYNLVNKIKDKTISEKMILIEKPTIDYTDSDLKDLNNILT
ncbi:MAG TPA: hypothetical protein VHJ38_16380 [Nitrososphaeraceae archaeon]|nr:hypothetical protein [Nitrososphaeraceae archaeon]